MRYVITTCWVALLFGMTAFAQPTSEKANYRLAAKFSPKRLEKMLFSTSVDPHWLKNTTRFWYMYETSAGKKWYIVDPVKGTRQPMFDNDRLAAAITRIVGDPFDAQHLGIENLKFLREDDIISFEVKSTRDVEKRIQRKKGPLPARRKKPSILNITS